MLGHFLDDRRLLNGPWQAFERDVARALVYSGYSDVRIVGGSGDKGADILAVKGGQSWVVQCKHTTSASPQKDAVRQVVDAGEYYKADRLLVATSRRPGAGFQGEVSRYAKLGIKVEVLDPSYLQALGRKLPEYSSARRLLRDYQQEAHAKLREALVDTGRGLAVLATGMGKTVVMAELVADLFRDRLVEHDRVLVLADKRELVRQLQIGFWNQLPKWVQTHRLSGDESPSYWEGITFATVQSVLSRQEKLPAFGLVLVDEAHHIGSPTFLQALDALKPKMLGGVTATPWRGDGFDIETILGQPLVQYGISEGLARGFLCDVDYRLFADNIDWNFVQERSAYNYSISQLNRKLLIPTRDQEAAQRVAQVFHDEKRRAGLVFCPTVEHAKVFSGILRSFGLKTETISAELPARDRDKLMSSFKRGDVDVLASVDLFNEGVDVPDVDLIVFMRATHSRRIFVQQIGRGLRVSEGKDKVVVLDFVTDLRRIAEIVELERAVANTGLETLPLGDRLIQFADHSAGSFMREWMKDQADLMLRENDPTLELPRFDFPPPRHPGNVQ
ncbi:DEAD/DEAH box helicase family protein [Ruegeria arenilitoris]|uniref:DEAD/DEAH box helicase family protein n=1 Tax=Ruegeria arenilitoris TaxID=1173585 RepID=UPI00147AACB9|nr:DEAD/DEAH box helicase family protein [Ruegeria arenilitoris]